jgi:adenylate kinase family enzyme
MTTMQKQFVNLLFDNLDEIAKVSTAGGQRAKLLGLLFEKNRGKLKSELIDTKQFTEDNNENVLYINEIRIGPFRGFNYCEIITFDKKYTFMYGPNGSGKSSFCEGLEYALLGNIEEADAKRIELTAYATNSQSGKFVEPVLYYLDANGQKQTIRRNPVKYRFSFIEKNRIDGFARISATTSKNQQDRIANLFGLDQFNDFINGFTDNFDGRYLPLENLKKKEFDKGLEELKLKKERIKEIKDRIEKYKQESLEIIKGIDDSGRLDTLEKCKLFLSGDDGNSGLINSLHEQKNTPIPNLINERILESLLLDIENKRN